MKLLKKIQSFLKSWLGCDSGPTVSDMVKMGMKMGRNVYYDASCCFDYSHCWLIEIGDDVTFGPRTYVLAHDASTKKYLGHTKIGKVRIENGCFIGAGSIIMPGVTVGKNSVIGAYSVVTSDVPEESVYAGNPAKYICTLEEYVQKQENSMKNLPVFDESYTLAGGITDEKKKEMLEKMKNGKGFVV